MSVVNHVLHIVLLFFLALALSLGLSFMDLLTVGPLIAVICAVPVTQGSLGFRKFAAGVRKPRFSMERTDRYLFGRRKL